MRKFPAQIREFKEGDTDINSAARMNEIVAALNCLLNLRAGPGINIIKAEVNMIIESTYAATNKGPE